MSNYPQLPTEQKYVRVEVCSEISWGSYLKMILECFSGNKSIVIWVCFGQYEGMLELMQALFVVKLFIMIIIAPVSWNVLEAAGSICC